MCWSAEQRRLTEDLNSLWNHVILEHHCASMIIIILFFALNPFRIHFHPRFQSHSQPNDTTRHPFTICTQLKAIFFNILKFDWYLIFRSFYHSNGTVEIRPFEKSPSTKAWMRLNPKSSLPFPSSFMARMNATFPQDKELMRVPRPRLPTFHFDTTYGCLPE